MSHAAYTHTAGHGATSTKGVASMFASVRDFFTRRAQLRAAERYLNAMDDRELTDIGVTRGDIHDVVWGRRSR